MKAVLRQQLEVLTGNRNASEVQIIAARVKAENEIAQLKRLNLAADQQAAKANLDLELQRNKLAADRLVLETQNAQLAARQSLNEAQANLDKLKADPNADPQQVKNAQAAVDRATGNVGFADKVAGDAKENLAQQDKLAAIAQTAQTAQQRAAIAQFEAADAARLQAAQLALVEAKATNIAKILQSTATPAQLERTVDQLVERNRRLTQNAPASAPSSSAPLSPIVTVPRIVPSVQPVFNAPIVPVNAAIAPIAPTPAISISGDQKATVGQLQVLVGINQQLLTANKDLGSTLLRIANRPVNQNKITVTANERDTILTGTGL